MEKKKNTLDRRIEIYIHPNPEIRSFLTNTEISAYRVEKFKKPPEKNWDHTLKQLGVIGAQVAKEILAIHGVNEIHIKPKEIRIKKEISSSWEAIEKKVVEILTRALRRKQIKVVKRQG
jgi:Zn-dependent membrane protease YugP